MADRIDSDWVDVPVGADTDWIDVPTRPTPVATTESDWTDVPVEPSLGSRVLGGLVKGEMRLGRATLGVPANAVRQAGFLRQWSWAEDVLREPDPKKQAELLKGMSESKQAFDATAKALEEAQDWHQQGMETIIARHPEWESAPPESFKDLFTHPDKLAVAIAESMPLLVGAGILTVAGQPQIATGLMVASEGQEAADQAIADGATKDEAALAYAIYGVVAGALEQMQLEGLAKIGKGMYNAVLNRTVQKVANKGLKAAVYGTIKVAAQEALEEMSQGMWQEITAKMVYDKDIPGTLADVIDRRAQEAYIAVIMSLLLGVGGGIAARVQARAPIEVGAPVEAGVEPGPVAEPATTLPTRPEFTTVSESVSTIPVETPDVLELERTKEAERRTRQLTEAHGQNREALRGQMNDLIRQAQETKNVNKMTRLADQMEILDKQIEDVSETNISKAGMIKLRRIAKRHHIEIPEGATRESVRDLLRGPQDIVQVRNGYVIRKPIAEKGAWELSEVYSNRQAAEDALIQKRAEEAVPIIPPTETTQQSVLFRTGEVTEPVVAEPTQPPTEVTPAAPEQAGVEATTQPEQPKKRRLSKRKALTIGHELPKKMGWSEAQRRDFMQSITGKTSMKGMKPAQMRQLVEALEEQARDMGVLAPEDYAKTIFIGTREVRTDEFIDEAKTTVEELKDLSTKAPKMGLRARAERGRGIIGTAKAILTGIDNLNVPYLMEKIGAIKDGIMREVGVTNWRRSKHHISAVLRGGVDMLKEATKAAGITDADLARISDSLDPRMALIKTVREKLGVSKTASYKFEANGKTFTVTMDELMDMYLASLQDTGPGHIETGGFVIRGYRTGGIDEAKMDEIRAIVEADEKAMALMNAVIKIADEYNAPQLNYTHGRLNPESTQLLADKTNYWHLEPYHRLKIRGKMTYTISLLENKGILKPRTGGKQPLVVRGLFPRFFAVQYAVAEYVGMAEELRLMNMILNNDEIIDTLEAKGYTDIRKNLKTLLEYVQSKDSSSTSTDRLLNKILHGAYRALLHYSPEVIVAQYMSTMHYAGVVDPKYAKLLAVPPTPKLVKEMLDRNPVVWQRYYAGGQSVELAELGQLDVSLRLMTGKHADLNKTGLAAQQTDLAAFAQGWKVAKAIVKDSGIAETDPLYWDYVSDKAEELWDTQPSWDKWGKSINTSQRGIKRIPFLFRSYFEKSLMMLHSANARYEASEKTAADRAKQAQVYGAVLGSQMATAIARTLIGGLIWRKRKDVWDYVGAVAGAPFSMMAVFGSYMGRVVGSMVKIMAGEKAQFEGEPISTLPGQVLTDIVTGSVDFGKAFSHYVAGDEEKAVKSLKTGTRKLVLNVGTVMGIPAKQINKIIKALEEEDDKKFGSKLL